MYITLPSGANTDWIHACGHPSATPNIGYSQIYGVYQDDSSLNPVTFSTTLNLYLQANANEMYPLAGYLLEPLDLQYSIGSSSGVYVLNYIGSLAAFYTSWSDFSSDLVSTMGAFGEPGVLVDVGFFVQTTTPTLTDVLIVVSQLTYITVTTDNTTYGGIFDTPRLAVPMIVNSFIDINMDWTTNQISVSASITGAGEWSGWGVPMTNGMLQGSTITSSMTVTFDYPSSSAISMSMIHQSDYGNMQVSYFIYIFQFVEFNWTIVDLYSN